MQRMLAAVLVGMTLAVVCWQSAARYFRWPTLHTAQILPESFLARRNVRKDLALLAAVSGKTPRVATGRPRVFAYSVVPGGVRDASELRAIAARDYVVRRHYAQFNFQEARLVRAEEARAVYLSYRVRDAIYWTRRRVRLHRGELLLTDGKITARARCGNQISDTAKPEVSEEEPDEDVLDRPVAELEPGPAIPVRPVLEPPDLPVGQPVGPTLFAGGFYFPYVPVGVPIPARICPADEILVDGHCKKQRHKPPAVPEPSTMLLVGSGLSMVLWQYRKQRSRRQSALRVQ
jgi:hypothetical protein